MRNVGSVKTCFKLSEFEPPQSDWGHTAYISVDTQEDWLLDSETELAVFFTPRRGTTFEEIEALVDQLNAKLDTAHFNIFKRTRR